jgi:hypothetical protein
LKRKGKKVSIHRLVKRRSVQGTLLIFLLHFETLLALWD